MVLPVIPHRLTKISKPNRWRLIKSAFFFSAIACFSNLISGFPFAGKDVRTRLGVSTNSWLYTSEVLKYYIFPNKTDFYDDLSLIPPTYFKNATLGPWLFCWLDPLTEFHCTDVDIIGSTDDPSDVTTSVEQSVRRSFVFMIAGSSLDVLGFLSIMLCCVRKNAYRTLFAATIINIFAGLSNFCCIIVYMSSVSKEVGNKIYKASEMDDSLFHYSYGFSLILLKMSFFCTEMAALFSTVVYMSKRDERTYNRYQMSTMLKNIRVEKQVDDENILNDRYYQHARFKCLEKASRSTSMDDSLQSAKPTPHKSLYLLPSELVEEPTLEGPATDAKSDMSCSTLTTFSKLSQCSCLSGRRSQNNQHPFLLGVYGHLDSGYI